MPLTGLFITVGVLAGILLGLIFRDHLFGLWLRLTGEFQNEQELQRLAQNHPHGHFLLTIAKYDRELPPIDCFEEADGSLTYVWDEQEFSNEEAANFARRQMVLAQSRAYYGDIDMWQKSLPPPPRPRYRQR